jgi:hypothetical protein
MHCLWVPSRSLFKADFGTLVGVKKGGQARRPRGVGKRKHRLLFDGIWLGRR